MSINNPNVCATKLHSVCMPLLRVICQFHQVSSILRGDLTEYFTHLHVYDALVLEFYSSEQHLTTKRSFLGVPLFYCTVVQSGIVN